MLPKQAVYVHPSRSAGSDFPTRLDAEYTTVVAATAPDQVPCVATVGGK
jgi:hypothetical protein